MKKHTFGDVVATYIGKGCWWLTHHEAPGFGGIVHAARVRQLKRRADCWFDETERARASLAKLRARVVGIYAYRPKG